MRIGYFSIITLVIATTIAIGACKEKEIPNEGPSRDSTHARSAGGALEDERETKAIDTEGFDLSRIGLLKTRIMDRTFKDINSILVVKQGKILIEEYFNGEDANREREGQTLTIYKLK
ncbi:MAG: hypothetical protein U9R17_04440 [Thermodesulfobacteriota bacterium]|nr:hypothetical protein [Thermodesulfobacteriota bacterium]